LQTGYFLKIADGIFSWASHAQKTVALSSTEAEYMALSDCSRQVVWIRSLLSELGYNLKPIPICGDNQGSIFMATNPITEKRSKHIDIRYHYIREVIFQKKVEIYSTLSMEQLTLQTCSQKTWDMSNSNSSEPN
jgi:hypothetical protein